MSRSAYRWIAVMVNFACWALIVYVIVSMSTGR